MPRFYFDTHVGRDVTVDAYGIELADAREAYQLAVDTLPDLTQSAAPEPGPFSVGVLVRSSDDSVVVEVSYDLHVKWSSRGRRHAIRVLST